jgi:hypothetical protein
MRNRLLDGSRLASELTGEQEILGLLRPIYSDLGLNPTELVKVTPSWGGWLNALRFCVLRADGAAAWVYRRDLDGLHEQELVAALRAFSPAPGPHRRVRECATSEQLERFDRQVMAPEPGAASPQFG